MRKYDYKHDTENGKNLHGHTSEEILQAGWYQLMQRKEQNLKQSKVRQLLKNDPRFKTLQEQAAEQVRKIK